MIGFDYDEKTFLGVTWKVILSGNDFTLKTGEVRGGIPVMVYKNDEYGMIALVYINDPIDIDIPKKNYNGILVEIKKQSLIGKPLLLYIDEKYKDLCSKWNNGNNTLYKLNDFLSKEFKIE
jgi:hypothetical protein